jgi:hypothetical protein
MHLELTDEQTFALLNLLSETCKAANTGGNAIRAWGMDEQRLYQILHPETRDPAARIFRGAHHAMVAAGIGIMLADTVVEWREAYARALDAGFQIACAFFFAEYVLRLMAATGAPGAAHRGKWPSRLAWATSLGGIFDFFGALPGVLDVVFNPGYASLFGFIWAFKLVRYSPSLASLGRVISNARQALLSVLLGFGILLLFAASLAYLLERSVQPDVFGSIPAALWWAIVTMTTTGYGDVAPQTLLCRMLAGVVMISGIAVIALSSQPVISRRRGGASFCEPGTSSPRFPSSTTSAPQSSPMSRSFCGRATIRPERSSCGSASAVIACISLPRENSKFAGGRRRYLTGQGTSLANSRC